MGREGGPDGRTAGGGGLNKGFDEGPHNHIAAVRRRGGEPDGRRRRTK